MICHRCQAKMLPSQNTCDYCGRFSDEELAARISTTHGARVADRALGYLGLAGSVLIMLAFVGAGMAGFRLRGLMVVGAAIVAVGAFGARKLERAKLYAHLSRA